MEYTKVAVLGAGAIGLTTSVDFFNAGFEVNLFELPKFKETIEPIMEKKQLEYTGAAGDKSCKLNMVTTDIKEAIQDVGLIILAIPAFAHETFMNACLPHLQDGQIILVETGYFASIRFAKDVKNTGKKVILSEFNSTPYCCRKKTPTKTFIDEKRTELLVAALPAEDTDQVLEILKKAYPKTTAGRNVIMTSLDLVNFIIHPPVTLFHKGLLERSKEYALPVKDSIPPSVVTYMDAMENERIAVGKAYGVDLPPIKHFYELGGDTLEDALRKSKEW
ncbi:MAG: NAD/NADP octopine/nopaline dehydrogenase family protein, partial [Planctomycetota bacterium]